MLHRRIEDEGPFYKLYPEGFIEHFNGRDIPTPHLLSDNAPDRNRNVSYGWAPEHRLDGWGRGSATLRVGSCRIGVLQRQIAI